MKPPVRVELGPSDELWLIESTRQDWHPRLVILFGDGKAMCSCERYEWGCRHVTFARDEQAAQFGREENWRTMQDEQQLEASGG